MLYKYHFYFQFSGREDEVKMGLIRDQVSSWTSGKQTEDKVRPKQGPSLPQPVSLVSTDSSILTYQHNY